VNPKDFDKPIQDVSSSNLKPHKGIHGVVSGKLAGQTSEIIHALPLPSLYLPAGDPISRIFRTKEYSVFSYRIFHYLKVLCIILIVFYILKLNYAVC